MQFWPHYIHNKLLQKKKKKNRIQESEVQKCGIWDPTEIGAGRQNRGPPCLHYKVIYGPATISLFCDVTSHVLEVLMLCRAHGAGFCREGTYGYFCINCTVLGPIVFFYCLSCQWLWKKVNSCRTAKKKRISESEI